MRDRWCKHGLLTDRTCTLCVDEALDYNEITSLRAELTAISDALGTNEGHSSVDNIRVLKSGRDLLIREIRKQDHSYLNTVVDNIMED